MTILRDQLNAVLGGDAADILADKLDDMQSLSGDAAAAQAACISQVITNGVTTKSPSEDAVFDALALKRATAFTPTTVGDWPVVPTTIQQALDYLADRLNVLEP